MSNWITIAELRDEQDDHLVVEITGAKRGREGQRVYAFCVFREFVKDGLVRRTTFLRVTDRDGARRLIDRAVERIEENP